MKKPVIGITLDSANNNEKYSYAVKPWYALRKCYSEVIQHYGGVPIMLPYLQDIGAIIPMIDSLMVPGGDDDINPKFYGQEIKSERVKTNDARAGFELALVAAALEAGKPVLGICNGLQVINTHFGGTLHQHLPDAIKSDINHEQPHPKYVPSHEIIIEEGTILSALCKERVVMVNSTHHQAIDRLGRGLIISARAPDGVIEAIESQQHRFVVGVEWHPEYLNSDLDWHIFKKLVEESSVVV